MAAVNPPYAIQARADHPARLFRELLASLRGVAGVIVPTDLAVTQQGTPNMSVNVGAGKAIVDGTQGFAGQGSYLVYNDATFNLTIAAADATNPRNDLIVAQVRDAEYSGANNDWLLSVIQGTPAASPSDPALPVNALVLARVRVNAAASSIVTANITDLRQQGVLINATTTPLVPSDAGAIGNIPLGARADHQHPRTGIGGQMVLINETLLGGVSGLISFSGIPSGFRHLWVEFYCRGDNVSTNIDLRMRMNNDVGANYDQQNLISTAAATSGTNEILGATSIHVAWISAASATAGYFGSGWIELPHYAGAVGDKHVNFHGGWAESNATGAASRFMIGSGKWRTIATAVNRLDFFPSSGNFVAGTLISLYAKP